MTITLEHIQAAAQRIAPAISKTPFTKSVTLSRLFGAELYIKFENMQFTASFKERGALNKLLSLQGQTDLVGVIAMSAGNHAQAVAYHAQRLGIPATIVMPKFTPNIKIEHTQNFGALVVLEGESLDQSAQHAQRLAREQGLTFIHPYDDELVMAGQGTVALEMLEVVPELDCIIVPVGGGGLIAGIATAAKALKPDIEIIGVEAANYPSVHNALQGHGDISGGTTIAEGIAVKHPGDLTLAVIKREVDDFIVVDDSAIEEAVSLYVNVEKTVAEGAGAASLAAVMAAPKRFQNKKVGLILSGANIDSRILASVLMRDLVRTGRIVRLHVKIDDSPGVLSAVSDLVGRHGGNILEVNHQRMFAHVRVKEADLNMTIETRDAGHTREILARLCEAGYAASLVKEE